MPGTVEVNSVDDQLILTARLIDADAAIADHLQAVTEFLRQPALLILEQHRLQLRPFVLEDEIGVAREGPFYIGYLAADTHEPEISLDSFTDLGVDLGDAFDRSERKICWRIHVEMVRVKGLRMDTSVLLYYI